MWKGGRLKLEKAKEHYISRLRREWTEDTELAAKLASQNFYVDESVHTLPKSKEDKDFEMMQLRLFFPKLRKIKPIPLKGTGKHKYSFQRVEVPPLPINFCDCEEHSRPRVSAKKNDSNDLELESFGVNEEELSIMKSVLNKLLEKENSSSKVSHEAKFNEINRPVTSGYNLQVAPYDEGQVSDDDNLVINVVGQPSFEDWRPKRTTNQDLSVEKEQFTGSRKTKLQHDKKRKASISENDTNDIHASKRMAKKGGTHDRKDDSIALNSVLNATESGSTQLSSAVVSARKSAWKTLVTEKGSASFRMSDILPHLNPDESGPRSIAPSSSVKDREGDQPDKTTELENLSDGQSNRSSVSSEENSGGVNSQDDQPIESRDLENLSDGESNKSSASERKSGGVNSQDDQPIEHKEFEVQADDVKPNKSSQSESKTARGAAWLQKSSWLQLVADTNKNSFSLAQIIPDADFKKLESQQFEINHFEGENPRFASEDTEFSSGGTSETHGRAKEALIKKQDQADLDGDKITSDGEQKVDKKDKAPASLPSKDPVPNKRPFGKDIVISETCPFMRSAASLKEWAKTKAALSSSLKKKGKVKESNMD